MRLKNPKVSIVCITYNHEQYIAQALDSFIAQQCDFPIEIIIADDSSTDRTQSIIRSYARKYRGIVVPILRKKNIGIGLNLRDALMRAKGGYIAMCEGDDYWTDYQKLALQVAYLDKHPQHTVCFHTTRVIFEDDSREEYTIPARKDRFNIKELIVGNFMHTSSVMYRRDTYDSLPVDMLPIDWYLNLHHAKIGKIGYIDRQMSVYRRNRQSAWFPEVGKMNEFWLKRGIAHAKMFEYAYQLFKDTPYSPAIEDTQNNWTRHLIGLDLQYSQGLIRDLCQEVPGAVSRYLKKESKESEQTKSELARTSEQLEMMKRSFFWKLRNKVVRMIGKRKV